MRLVPTGWSLERKALRVQILLDSANEQRNTEYLGHLTAAHLKEQQAVKLRKHEGQR